MCSECLSYYCPKNCPNYDGYSPFFGEPQRFCELCDSPIYEDDKYYDICGTTVCCECIEQIDIYELLELLGYEKTSELLEHLGYEPTRA